jgi:signal transduction histidine kinase
MNTINRRYSYASARATDAPQRQDLVRRKQELVRRNIPTHADLSAFAHTPDVRPYRDRDPRPVPDSAERNLSRLRFDLHDGPQQDVILLAEDLRMFREQFAGVIADPRIRDRVLGWVDDLEARLIALEGDLRRISASLLSPFLQRESLPDAIAQLAEAFTDRTRIEPDVEVQGDMSRLSDSQQIALLAVTREALANIRQHSDAEHVAITLSNGDDGIHATVTDDGCGFEPDAALVAGARAGHLGLVGMHERVRLLGGQMNVDSRPGGPTVISVSLPAAARWTAPVTVGQRA